MKEKKKMSLAMQIYCTGPGDHCWSSDAESCQLRRILHQTVWNDFPEPDQVYRRSDRTVFHHVRYHFHE